MCEDGLPGRETISDIPLNRREYFIYLVSNHDKLPKENVFAPSVRMTWDDDIWIPFKIFMNILILMWAPQLLGKLFIKLFFIIGM